MRHKRACNHRVYPLVHVEMLVRYKDAIPDPQKKDLDVRLSGSGYELVSVADYAKFFHLKFKDSTLRKARAMASRAGKDLLANPVIETFEIIRVKAN